MRTPSHGAKILSPSFPQICISSESGEPLDSRLKQEISHQVRELRKQGQRGVQDPKGSNRSYEDCSGKSQVSQSNPVPKPCPPGQSNQKQKPRDRPHSASSQAAIRRLTPPDQQVKALQPQAPGQVQTQKLRSDSPAIPAVKLVGAQPRHRSLSPCCRKDVDIEDEYLRGWHKELRQTVSTENLRMPSNQEQFDQTDPLSQSFPVDAFQLAPARHSKSYSPSSNSSHLLTVPDYSPSYCSPSGVNSGVKRGMQNPAKVGSSMLNLSSSAPANAFRQDCANLNMMRFPSSEHLASPNCQPLWLSFSAHASPQNSNLHAHASAKSRSNSITSSLSPDSPWHSMANIYSPSFDATLLPSNQKVFVFVVSPDSTPLCSPCGSPFGSQAQITIRSVGAE